MSVVLRYYDKTPKTDRQIDGQTGVIGIFPYHDFGTEHPEDIIAEQPSKKDSGCFEAR